MLIFVIYKTMGLRPGHTNNPNGRPRGSKDKVNTEIKEMVKQFISGNLKNLQKNYDTLVPARKLKFFESLLQYVIPKQRDLKISEYEEYSDEQLRQIASEIIEQSENGTD